ncbi:MAG: hypothetical protein AAB152_15815, partial [Candidatus Coatesbacteria bacterium]
IAITNTGGVVIDSLTIVDTVSPLLQNAITTQPGFPAPAVTSVAGSGSRYVWSAAGLGLAPAGVVTITLDAQLGVVCGAPKGVSNTAYVTARDVVNCAEVRAFANMVGSVVAPPVDGITIVKTQIPASPVTGGPVTYQFLVTNTGASTVTDLVVVDSVSPVITAVTQTTPAGFAAQPVAQSVSGTIYSWVNAAPFLPGTSATFQLDGTVGAVCFETAVSNTGYVAANTTCATLRVASNVKGFVLTAPTMSIAVAKTQTGGNGIGAPIQYQIAITNTGGVVIDSLTIVDTVSPLLQNAITTQPGFPAPAVTSVAGSGSRYVWSAAGLGLAPAGVVTITLDAQLGVVCGAPKGVSNTAYVTARDVVNCAEVRGFSNMVGLVVQPATAGLTVTKTQNPASGSSLATGTPITYTFLVANTGAATLTSLVVTDTLPPEVTQVALTPQGGFGGSGPVNSPSGSLYAWTGAGLNFLPGTSMSFTLSGVVGEMCTAKGVTNTAYAAATTDCAMVTGATAPVQFTGQPYAVGVSIVKNQILPLTPTVSSGVPVRYQIVVTNTGAATLTDLIVVDTLQVELEAVTATAPGLLGLPTNLAGGGTRWVWSGTGLVFLPNATLTITIDAKTGFVAGLKNVSNTAFVAATNGCGLAVATAQTTPATGFDITPASPSLAVRKFQVPASGGPAMNRGNDILYRIVVVNTSGVTLDNITVTDTVAPEVTLQATEQDNSLFSVTATSVASGTRYEWRNVFAGGLTFGPGQTFSFTVTGKIGHVCAPTTRDNYAVAEGSSLGVTAPTALSAPVRFVTNPVVPSVLVTHTVSPLLPASGGPMNYAIAVTNTGAETLSNLELTDTLPPVAKFTATQTGGDVVPAIVGSLYDWTLGALKPGETRTFFVSGIASDCFSGVVANTAMLTGDTPCTARITQQATASVLLQAPSPNLVVWKDFFPDDPTRTTHTKVPQMGMPIYWKLIVKNTGGKPAENVVIVDTLPSVDAAIERIEIPVNGWPKNAGYPQTAAVLADTGATTTVFYTVTGSGGLMLAVIGGPGFTIQPGESVTLYVDMTPYMSDVGAKYVSNVAFADATNPCSGSRQASQAFTAGFALVGKVTLTVKIFNAAGEIVRSFDPILVGRSPTLMSYSYTGGPACGTNWAVSATLAFSPDGDCFNDYVKLVFPELLMADGMPFDLITWDGKSDQGIDVPNGVYIIDVQSVDIQSGAPVSIRMSIVVAARHTQVVARIYNSAGELIAVLPTAGLSQPVDSIKIDWVAPDGVRTPLPFKPDLAGVAQAQVHLFDAKGNEIGVLPWAGRTCDTADKTCATA